MQWIEQKNERRSKAVSVFMGIDRHRQYESPHLLLKFIKTENTEYYYFFLVTKRHWTKCQVAGANQCLYTILGFCVYSWNKANIFL